MRDRNIYLIFSALTVWGRSRNPSDFVIYSFSITQCFQPSRYQKLHHASWTRTSLKGRDDHFAVDGFKEGEKILYLWRILACSNNIPLVDSSFPDSYQPQLVNFRKVIRGISRWSWGRQAVSSILGNPFSSKERWEFHFLIVFASRHYLHLLPVLRIHPFIYSSALCCVLSSWLYNGGKRRNLDSLYIASR